MRMLCGAAALWMGTLAPAARADDADPRQFVQFVEDYAGSCVSRNGVQVLVKNTHPTRTVRVWLDRYHMGTGTGDRSRSDLKPGGEPEPLGCSRTLSGPQEWRIVRAQFVN
jgi:hypothetical protein